jgi:hypothetical protein
VLAAALLSCSDPPAPVAPATTRIARSFQLDPAPIRNPERGLLQYVDINDPGDVRFVANLGVSLANARIRLDEFRGDAISGRFLHRLGAGFARIRKAGLKLVLRFQYNIGSGKDPPLRRVIAHIDQLAPVLRKNADIIAVLQAGFIGAWGEWHTSTSGLTDRKARGAILRHLLAAVPPSRSVQVRSPVFKRELAGGPLSAATAYRGDALSRIGHHNDCLLSNETDHGTFPSKAERDYLAADAPFVPVGGETCAEPGPRSSCLLAVAELRRYHYSYLNRAYHPAVIAAWKKGGCFETIDRNLGYRLALQRATWPAKAPRGSRIRVTLELTNIGFAAPFNPRTAYLMIGPRRFPIASLDVRRLQPRTDKRIDAEITIPAGMTRGRHDLALWLPDPAPALRDRPLYAIRLANQDTWVPKRGSNLLGQIEIY